MPFDPTEGWPGETGDMREPDEYRRSAARCWRLAQAARDADHRAFLLSVAGTWVALANQTEKLEKMRSRQTAIEAED